MESEEQHEVNLRAQLQSALGASFEILELIGQGGMATVYRARQPHPSREVAIKVLDPDITTRLIRQRFVREIEVISTLNHPHIVPIYEAGERNELLYYVMPFIDTYTLRQRLTSEGSLGIDETVRMALELADALAYAHDRNVIHRDIKPDNVLLSGGHAIISDFGIARAVECAECATEDVDDVLTAVGRPLGTPLYMSPEQAAGSADLDHRADIYSLGCVVYEMLAGSPPYPGSTPHEIMMKHTVDPVPRVHGLSETIPSHVKSAIRRAMSKDPAARFDDAREFAAALAPRESGRFQVVGQLATRKRPVVMAVAAVVTAVIALPIGMKLMLSSALPELVSDRIAVVALQSSPPGGSSSVGVMASDWVARSLEQTRLLDVVRVGVDGPGNTPRETAVWLQAGLTLTGTYSLNGDSLTLGYDLIDHLSGNRYGTGELLVNGSDPTLAAVSLQRAVFEVLAEEVEPLLAHWTRSSSWPPEPEIYRGYIDARACWANSDYECALAEVTAVSAEFPAAALLLARTHFELGDWELALRVISGIDDRDSTLTPVELNRLAFLQARLEGDPQGAHDAISRAAAISPRADILLQVAASRFALDLPRSASDALARIDPTRLTERERFAFFELANSIHHRLFQFDRALDFAAQETVLLNDAWSARLHSASTLAAMGNRTGLLGLIGDLDIPVAARTLLLERVVGELRAHGTPDLADSLQGELVEAYRELLRLAPQSSEYRLGLARSLYRMGRADLASELVRGLLGRMGRNPTSLGLQGTILARLGNAEAALNVMENLNTFDRPGDRGRSRYEQSRIATALDDWNLAIDLLIEAHQQGVDLYPTHADPDFIRLQDFGPYRVLIRPKG